MSSWQRSGGILFENVSILENIDIPLEKNDIVALSRFGGPIATFDIVTSTCRVFGGGGKWISSWTCPEKVCQGGFGWTEDMVLTFVCQDDSIYVWDDFIFPMKGPRKLKIKFGHQIIMVHFWSKGIIALTSKYSVLVMKDLRSCPIIQWTPITYPIARIPRCICVLKPQSTNFDSQLEIAIALPDQPGMLVGNPEKKLVEAKVPIFRAFPSRFLEPHPTDSIIASLDISDRLLIVNTSWEDILFARDNALGDGFNSPPVSLSWCMGGSGNSVMLLWNETPWSTTQIDDELKFGPGGLVIGFLSSSNVLDQQHPVARFSFGSPAKAYAVAEMDGVRVFSGNKMNLIRRVSRCTQSIEAVGSLSPAALLVESCSESSIPSFPVLEDAELILAIEDLLDGTKFELNFKKKMSLLRAAQVGKDQIEIKIEEKASLARLFVEICQFTKALQLLIEAKTTCATPIQALSIGLETFAARILSLGFINEIKTFAMWTKIPLHPILLIEARTKGTDIKTISNILFNKETFTRCEAAGALGCEASSELAPLLCENESRFNRKIICLLKLNEFDRVLNLLDSRGVDFDLKARTVSYFLTRNHEVKIALNATAEQTVRAIYKSANNAAKLERWLINISSNKQIPIEKRNRASAERALLLLASGVFEDDYDKKKKVVLLEEASREFEGSGRAFLAAQTKEFVNLLALQTEFKIPIGKSVLESIVDCFARGKDEIAEKLRKVFSVKPILYWKARVRGMGKSSLWVEAARLALTDKEASRYIRVDDILELCFEQGALSSASRIAFELQDEKPEKSLTFARLKMWPEAMKAAEKSNNVEALNEIYNKCKDEDLKSKALKLIQNIGSQTTSSDQSNSNSLLGLIDQAKCNNQ